MGLTVQSPHGLEPPRPQLAESVGLIDDQRQYLPIVVSAPATVFMATSGCTCRQVPRRRSVTLYYVTSEALTNVLKHAHASTVYIELSRKVDVVHLTIRDDGSAARPGRRFGPDRPQGSR
jgi:glucose-6-phosphate-specific signal transduction histidine kinase